MSKHAVRLAEFTIKANERESNDVELKTHGGVFEVITIYAPKNFGSGPVLVYVAQDMDSEPVQFYVKGQAVKLESGPSAYNVPVPAADKIRLVSMIEEPEDRVFSVRVLQEI